MDILQTLLTETDNQWWLDAHEQAIKDSGRRTHACRICRTVKIPVLVHACPLCD